MPFLVPQVTQLDPRYDGTRALPHRLERVARLLVAGELSHAEIAERCKTSRASITRLNRQPHFRSRLIVLQERAAERAQAEEPLSYKGNRIALAGKTARELRERLVRNGYETTIAVDKQGKAIAGFDRGAVAELLKSIALIHDMQQDKRSTIADTTNVAVQVTMTTEQAVTKVQALLSRASAIEERAPTHAHAHAHEGQAPPMGMGVEGGISGADTLDKDGAVPDTEYTNFSGTKAALEAEYTKIGAAKGGEE